MNEKWRKKRRKVHLGTRQESCSLNPKIHQQMPNLFSQKCKEFTAKCHNSISCQFEIFVVETAEIQQQKIRRNMKKYVILFNRTSKIYLDVMNKFPFERYYFVSYMYDGSLTLVFKLRNIGLPCYVWSKVSFERYHIQKSAPSCFTLHVWQSSQHAVLQDVSCGFWSLWSVLKCLFTQKLNFDMWKRCINYSIAPTFRKKGSISKEIIHI